MYIFETIVHHKIVYRYSPCSTMKKNHVHFKNCVKSTHFEKSFRPFCCTAYFCVVKTFTAASDRMACTTYRRRITTWHLTYQRQRMSFLLCKRVLKIGPVMKVATLKPWRICSSLFAFVGLLHFYASVKLPFYTFRYTPVRLEIAG